MHITSTLLAASALASHVVATPFNRNTGLWEAMQARGRNWLGVAVTFRNDTKEAARYGNKSNFNSFTPENAMKWDSTEPSRGNFTFDAADQFADYARTHGIQLHCHNLVWHSQLPTWVSDGNWTKEELTEIMTTHINTLAGRYTDVCTRWDVVNEALNENGTYRSSIFYNTLGDSFLPLAFRLAAAATPNSHLFYNDYNLETAPEKAAGAQRIVKLIQDAGERIDGVGLQAHLSSEVTPTSQTVAPSKEVLEGVLRGFTDLGVDVAYTELDVRMNTPATKEKLKVQKKVYEDVAASCLAVERCVGMTVWGVSDKYSWIPDTFEGEGAALMWDEGMKRKPAYYGFLRGIEKGCA